MLFIDVGLMISIKFLKYKKNVVPKNVLDYFIVSKPMAIANVCFGEIGSTYKRQILKNCL